MNLKIALTYSCFLLILTFSAKSQTPLQRSVDLSAVVQENPPQIDLSWTPDETAEKYTVYRKPLADRDWGTPIAELPGTATSFLDTNVVVGIGYEYAFYKTDFEPFRDTFCVAPGSNLTFSINTVFGESLCCNFGFGYYQLNACNNIEIRGEDIGFGETQNFTVCPSDQSCVEVYFELQSNIFPHLNSWSLFNNSTGTLVADSGPQGTLVDDRPSFGYIYSGIKLPPLESRGTMLLLIDDLFQESLATEIQRLKWDLIGDGWEVQTQYVPRTMSVTAVKEVIKSYNQSLENLNALFILGHVAVPYAGDIYPDTHTEHRGAWAADVYYAELDSAWTDDTVNRATAFFEYNHNVPGDGKFDQSYLMDEVDLQMGRVDFFNMPAFNLSEAALLKRYLDKNHQFRNQEYEVVRRALIDDNFGQAFNSPSSSAWRNFAQLVGRENVQEIDYFSTLRNESYLWSFGCGSGSHISAEGIGNTNDFANDSLQTVFTLLFGSQFGDWDNVNNFLRAPLASGMTLTNAWAGSNPFWTLHHMAMGYPIGYATLQTQNSNDGVYIPGPQLVHLALMGDPSLRLHPVKGVDSLSLSNWEEGVLLNWAAVNDPQIEGYHIYRADSVYGKFVRINESPITINEYLDEAPIYGKNVYMVRPMKLEESASGTYYNLGQGQIDSTEIFLETSVNETNPLNWKISPNPASNRIFLELDNLESGKNLLEIFNNLGQNVLSMPINSVGQKIYHEIDVSNLNSGIFFVTIKNRNFIVSKKIILR